MGPDEFDIVLRAVDLLTIMMRELPERVATGMPSAVTDRRDALMEAVDALIAGGSSAPAPEAEPEAGPEPIASASALRPVTPGGTAGVGARRASEAMSTIKVDTGKLDNLIDMVGELVIAQSILAEYQERSILHVHRRFQYFEHPALVVENDSGVLLRNLAEFIDLAGTPLRVEVARR
jgi:chemotaxis protein histidine kinase CheA